jgi:hypothetical protein
MRSACRCAGGQGDVLVHHVLEEAVGFGIGQLTDGNGGEPLGSPVSTDLQAPDEVPHRRGEEPLPRRQTTPRPKGKAVGEVEGITGSRAEEVVEPAFGAACIGSTDGDGRFMNDGMHAECIGGS